MACSIVGMVSLPIRMDMGIMFHQRISRCTMAMTRGDYKKRIKWPEGLDPDVADDLLSEDLLNTAVDDALKKTALDLRLLPVWAKIALRIGKYEYPMPNDCLRLESVYYLDDDEYVPLTYVNKRQFYDGFDKGDTDNEPNVYSIGNFQGQVIEFWVGIPPTTDYLGESVVTAESIRTLIDTAVNFAKTRTGRRIKPKDIVHNIDDGSYGFVEVLDITTNITTGTATSGTGSTALKDTTKNFTTLGIDDRHIICTPSTGIVTSYAFIDSVSGNTVTYSDIQGDKTTFAASDTYKIGLATEIRLSEATPHPGLRNGSDNTFDIGDSYQIESRVRDERCLLIGPVASGSDSAGVESVHVSYYARPELPLYDHDLIEIDDRYEEVFSACLDYYVAKYSSKYNDKEKLFKEQMYDQKLRKHTGDVDEPPRDVPVNFFTNRVGAGTRGSSSDRTASGLRYNVS
jgi:hypothetical protein